MKPKVAILFAEGTNFEVETKYAFEKAGASAQILPMSEVLARPKMLESFQLIDFPGGFSYGDDLLSGKIWANQVRRYLMEEVKKILKKGRLIIGVCNGFQALIRSGLLPEFGVLNKSFGLIINEKQKFECRWVRLSMRKNRCVFLVGDDLIFGDMTVEHGEGRFISDNKSLLDKLKDNKQIVFQYANENYQETDIYPDNPNGSFFSIAGICDPTGQILGMMPHPEHYIEKFQHPNWRRRKTDEAPFGLTIYKKAVDFLKKS